MANHKSAAVPLSGMRHRLLTAVIHLACVTLSTHVLFAAPAGLECVEEITLPRYTYVARRAPTGGTVRALVTIGRLGKAGEVTFVSSDPDLAQEVRNYLGSSTTYKEACEGKQIELLFTFKLEGESELDPPVWIRSRPPNHFLIVSRPRKPNIN